MTTFRKVLILDQSPIFRRTLKEVIQTSETEVEIKEADSAAQARALLQTDPVDVVFFDIALSRENGLAFIADIKAMLPDSHIVVLTCYDSAEYEAASLENGADYFLSKERSGGLRLLDVIHAALRRNGNTRPCG